LRFSRLFYVEGADAELLKEGEEVTLMDWGNAIIEKKILENGKIVKMTGKLHLEGNFKTTKMKINWLPKSNDLSKVSLFDYDHLITKSKLEEEDKFEDFINPNSVFVTTCIGCPNLKSVPRGQRVQLERRGYYIVDRSYIYDMQLVGLPYNNEVSTLASAIQKNLNLTEKTVVEKKKSKERLKNRIK